MAITKFAIGMMRYSHTFAYSLAAISSFNHHILSALCISFNSKTNRITNICDITYQSSV